MGIETGFSNYESGKSKDKVVNNISWAKRFGKKVSPVILAAMLSLPITGCYSSNADKVEHKEQMQETWDKARDKVLEREDGENYDLD